MNKILFLIISSFFISSLALALDDFIRCESISPAAGLGAVFIMEREDQAFRATRIMTIKGKKIVRKEEDLSCLFHKDEEKSFFCNNQSAKLSSSLNKVFFFLERDNQIIPMTRKSLSIQFSNETKPLSFNIKDCQFSFLR